MQSFLIILQKIIKSKDIIFSNDPKDFPLFLSKNYHEDFLYESMTIHHIIFFMMHKHNSSININDWVKHKYKLFGIHILDNLLIANVLRDKLLHIIFKSQKAYNGFAKLANIYKYKKYKTVISDDLTLNPLDEKDRHTFILIQNNCKYLFSIRDLINIIETSLLNNARFFSEPMPPKNPYNNIKLNNAALYNIYFKMKTTILSSQLFDMYYLSNFSLQKFRLDNEPFLRDISIKNYTYKSPPNILRLSIIEMLKSNSHTKKLKIDKDFPSDLLAEIFRPFLYNYLLVYYNFLGLEKNNMLDTELHHRLCNFYNYNPNFGRKYTQKKNIFGKIEETILINTNYLSFYGKRICNNQIDKTCVYLLDPDEQRDRININTPVIERQTITVGYIQPSSSIISNETPNHSPNDTPNTSPTAPQNDILFIELYNQLNNELSDDTLSETNEDISVS